MKFFKLLGFVLSAQTTHLFQFKNTLSVIGRVFFVFIVLVYAVGFGMAFHYADRLETSPETILNAINTALAVMMFTKSFFPAFQPVSQPLAAFYPASRFTRAFMGISIDALSLFPLMMLVFYSIVIMIGASVLAPVQILLALLFFLTALFLDRSVRLLVEYNVRFRWLYMACVLVLAGLLVGRIAVPAELRPASTVLVPLLFVISAGMQFVLALESVKPLTERVQGRSASSASIHGASTTFPYSLKAFFGAKHIRSMLFMALALKCLLLANCVLTNKAENLASWNRLHFNIQALFIAPIAWFTYVLNNSFGMNWQLWQTHELHSTQKPASLPTALLLYIRHTALLLALDAVLTFSALSFGKMLSLPFVVAWIASAVSLFAVGAVVAITKPIKVEKLTASIFTSFRQVSPPLGMIAVFMVIVAVGFLSFAQALYALIIPLVVVPFAIFFILRYPTLKHNLYNGIHH